MFVIEMFYAQFLFFVFFLLFCVCVFCALLFAFSLLCLVLGRSVAAFWVHYTPSLRS